MPTMIDPVAFWKFKAQCAEADLAVSKLRLQLQAAIDQKNGFVDAFAKAHGLDPAKPIHLEDTDCSATQ